MSVPTYPEYKDSGVAWLGAVPGHWEIAAVKRHVRLITERAETRTWPVALENIQGWTGLFLPTDTDFEGEGTAFNAGDILYGKLRPYLAKVYVADLSGEAIGDFHVMRPIGQDAHFISYQLRTRELVSVVDGSTYGSKMPRASWDFVGGLPVAFPPLPEQTAIASFLDRETAKIDGLVAEQERLIALLKEKRQAVISHAVTKGLNPGAPLKDSGIEWLGQIPAHWEVVRLGSLYREVARTGSDELPILSVSIHRGVSDYEIADEDMERNVARSEDRSKYKRVQPNDLVYNMMRAWQGGFGAVQTDGQVSPAYVVAQPICAIRSEYIEALLRTPCAVEEMRRYSRGVTDFRLRLYWDEFKDIKIALPPSSEIDAILEVGASIAAQYTALEDVSRNGITLLQERRAALISAAVTGKIDVRAAVAKPELETA